MFYRSTCYQTLSLALLRPGGLASSACARDLAENSLERLGDAHLLNALLVQTLFQCDSSTCIACNKDPLRRFYHARRINHLLVSRHRRRVECFAMG